jgi:glycosyltransferase involved in cell wall biosynthesis
VKISIVLPDLRGGGAEKLHVHLAEDWIAKGLAVEFILMRAVGQLHSGLSSSISVLDLRASRIRNAILPLRRHLRRSDTDVLLAAMWPLTSAAIVAWHLSGRRSRIFVSDHNQLSLSAIREMRTSSAFLRASMRLTYPLADGVIAVSHGVKKDLCQLGGLNPSQVQVIWNPAAVRGSSVPTSSVERERIWGDGFTHHILSVGNLKPQKDHESLLRAFAQLPSSIRPKLIILGDGPLRERLGALIVELGLAGRVEILGFVSDPFPWFRSADLFVLSSRWEGFGNVLVEALECGLPIVSTDCPSGPAEILDRGRYGMLVPVGDVQSLARAITRSLGAAPDRDRLISRSQEFSIQKISEQYLTYMLSTTTCHAT